MINLLGVFKIQNFVFFYLKVSLRVKELVY